MLWLSLSLSFSFLVLSLEPRPLGFLGPPPSHSSPPPSRKKKKKKRNREIHPHRLARRRRRHHRHGGRRRPAPDRHAPGRAGPLHHDQVDGHLALLPDARRGPRALHGQARRQRLPGQPDRLARPRRLLVRGHRRAAHHRRRARRRRLRRGRVRADGDGAAPGARRAHQARDDGQQTGQVLPGADVRRRGGLHGERSVFSFLFLFPFSFFLFSFSVCAAIFDSFFEI